jgi:hypothetical protein
MPMHRAMSADARHSTDIQPVDIQRLLVWYYECVDPGRPRIRLRGEDIARPAAIASAGL